MVAAMVEIRSIAAALFLSALSCTPIHAEAPDGSRPETGQQSPSLGAGQVPPTSSASVAETPAKAGKPVDTAAQRRLALEDLYAYLEATPDAHSTVPLVAAIERLWLYSGSDTIDVLMERALKAVGEQDLDLAEKFTDTIVELDPGFAEGWNRKALVAYLRNDYEGAMDALRRVLALEPSHFKALDGLAQVLSDAGEKKAALATYRRLLAVHPYWQGAKEAAEKLEEEVEGHDI